MTSRRALSSRPTLLAGVLLASTPSLFALDWPSWRGPNRDGLCQEKGLLKAWPSGGPPLAWKVKGVGEGYSSVSVAKGRIYTMGNRGGNELVIALDEENGKEVWATPTGPRANVDYSGPRCTPTIDGDFIYALGVDGVLVCLDVKTGKQRWQKDIRREFKGDRPGWGYSESPLVDGNIVLCTPGGKGATIVALDKKTGGLVWKSDVPRGNRRSPHETKPGASDGAQYSSIIAAEVGGVKQYIQFLQTGVAGVWAKDGSFLWRYNKPANGTANISTPIFRDGLVFTASGYGTGGGLAKLTREGNKIQASEVAFTENMQNHHGGMVLVGDHLYGFDEGTLRCLEFKTLKEAWQNRSVGKGSVLYADGCIYARSEGGRVALVEASPEKYVEKGRFEQPDRSREHAWAHPVIANGRLYLRDQDVLLCYDVREERTAGAGGSSSTRASGKN